MSQNNDRFTDEAPDVKHIRDLSDSSPSAHVRITNAGQMRDLSRAISSAVRRAVQSNTAWYVYRLSANKFDLRAIPPEKVDSFCIFEAKPASVFLMEEADA